MAAIAIDTLPFLNRKCPIMSFARLNTHFTKEVFDLFVVIRGSVEVSFFKIMRHFAI